MKQIIFEKLTIDEQEKVQGGAEVISEPTPDVSGCTPAYDRPTAACQP